MINARIVLSRRFHRREIHLPVFWRNGISNTLYTIRWVLSKGIEAYSHGLRRIRAYLQYRSCRGRSAWIHNLSRRGNEICSTFPSSTISHLPLRKILLIPSTLFVSKRWYLVFREYDLSDINNNKLKSFFFLILTIANIPFFAYILIMQNYVFVF